MPSASGRSESAVVREAIEAYVGGEAGEAPVPGPARPDRDRRRGSGGPLRPQWRQGAQAAAHARHRPQVILVDTGPIVALLRRPDQHHERCLATLQELREPLATVWPVVTEAMFLLADRPDVQAALWRRFETEAIRLLPLGPRRHSADPRADVEVPRPPHGLRGRRGRACRRAPGQWMRMCGCASSGFPASRW